MDDNYSEKIRENSLFHYTDTKGLIGILKTGNIWATAPHISNDLLEFKVGLELLRYKINDLVKKYVTSIYTQTIIWHRLETKTNEALSRLNFFITSFTKAKDEKSYKNGQLSQWRSYGHKGYAIVLNEHLLMEDLTNQKLSGVLNSVFYKENENKFLDCLLEIYKREVIYPYIKENRKKGALFIEDNREKEKERKKEFEQLHNDFLEELTLEDENGASDRYMVFLHLMTLSKAEYFEEENEHRLSYFISDITNNINLFEKNDLPVPYVYPMVNFLDYVTKIIIGPSARMNDKKKSLELFLKSNHKERKIKVYESNISFSEN